MTDSVDFRNEDLQHLQRQITWLRAGLIIALLLIVGLALMLFVHQPQGVIRTHGIVIVDAQGRERILIGAPVPTTTERTRKNAETQSIVFLGADGADRLILGQAPGPYINGKAYPRIGDAYGFVLHDEKGNERGGFAYLNIGRVALGLDRPGGDAVGLMVDDKSKFAGMLIGYADPAAQGPAIKLGADAGQTNIQLFGKNGHPQADLTINGTAPPTWRLGDAAAEQAKP